MAIGTFLFADGYLLEIAACQSDMTEIGERIDFSDFSMRATNGQTSIQLVRCELIPRWSIDYV